MTADPAVRPALGIRELMVATGYGRDTVLRMCREGRLPAHQVRPGGKFMVAAAAFDAWATEQGRLAAVRSQHAHDRSSGAEAPRFIRPVDRRAS